jgi:N-acetyl-gamma-glutamyl-phosphate reductase
MKSVYIAGQSGTSGLVLHALVQPREDLCLLSLPDPRERDAVERETELLNSAEVVILCLPPVGVEEALGRITNPNVKVIDNSSAHRISEGWVYGLPELDIGQREAIRRARRVSGPGCFATGFILALRPLVEWGLVDPRAPVCVQGIGGYSAGGKRMIARFERPQGGQAAPFIQVHGLDLNHAQVPEMQHHARLQRPPLFVPLLGHFRRGMLVCIPLHRDWLGGGVSPATLREALRERYARERLVSVKTRPMLERSILLPQTMGCGVELYVEGNDEHLLLLARLDNLGKGSAIASIQNMNLLLGCDEFAGMVVSGEPNETADGGRITACS